MKLIIYLLLSIIIGCQPTNDAFLEKKFPHFKVTVNEHSPASGFELQYELTQDSIQVKWIAKWEGTTDTIVYFESLNENQVKELRSYFYSTDIEGLKDEYAVPWIFDGLELIFLFQYNNISKRVEVRNYYISSLGDLTRLVEEMLPEQLYFRYKDYGPISSLFKTKMPSNLSSQSLKMHESYVKLRSDPDNHQVQIGYLSAFPGEISDFKAVYDPDDFNELYSESNEYIYMLQFLATIHSEEVGSLLINLIKNASKSCCDAWSWLRSMTAAYAVDHTQEFAKILNLQDQTDIDNVIWRLADVENHDAYEEYPKIIARLQEIGELNLAHKFNEAKVRRISMGPHHEAIQ